MKACVCPRCRGPTIPAHDPQTGLVVPLDPHPVHPSEASARPEGVWRRHPKRGVEHVALAGATEEHPLHAMHTCTTYALF